MFDVRRMRGALSARRFAFRSDGSVCERAIMNQVIIGSGVAGIAAIEAIRSTASVSEVTLIGDDPYGFYSRPGLAYYLTGELHNKALFPRTTEELRKLNFRYMRGKVTKILRAEHVLELENQSTVPYDRLLIAVGAQ